MEPFIIYSGIVAPMDRANVDTDMIIPKQFLKSVQRTGFGPQLFDQLRYLDEGQPGIDNDLRPVNTEFVLNRSRYKNAGILLARENFGCGSSREHAPWALLDYGFRVILSPGFADIFYNNCFKNGILPIVLAEKVIDQLFVEVENTEGFTLEVDLKKQEIIWSSGASLGFEIDSFHKNCLLNGLDDIGITLEKSDLIKEYEYQKKEIYPWLFTDLTN
jgi:3-isopropylmalate/(R)-2-methylmalate dehydratase small subunit